MKNFSKLYFDGASKGNPGPASYGGVIFNPDGSVLKTYKNVIGTATNNVAEYKGLIAGLQLCISENVTRVAVYGDSNLVIQQSAGKWKVRCDHLRPLHEDVLQCIKKIGSVQLNHVKRKYNARADALANDALRENS